MKSLSFFFISFLIIGCAVKQPIKSQSATIIFKTPTMKFYDKGFLTYYDDYIHLQILNLGNVLLDLKVYKDKICKSTFKCMSNKEFNINYLSKDYSDNFMINLLKQKNIYFKDKKNHILIKITKDNND